MHDAGKAASGFQKVLRGEQRNWHHKRHEILSASLASNVENASPAVIFAILTHHKSIPSDGISQTYGCLPWEQIPLPNNETPLWSEMAKEWKENSSVFLSEWKRINEYLQEHFPSERCTLTPLSLNISWLERTTGRRGQRRAISFEDRRHASIIRGLTIASDHLGSAHKTPPPIPDLRKFSVLQKNTRPFQERMSSIEGSAILRAPTGSGKTEAALLWAQKNQRSNGRLFYVLPYTASINAMHRRLAKIFGSANVGLLHHRATSSLYNTLETDDDIASRLGKQQTALLLATLAREIWFPARVCTPHQIIRYSLRGKGWEIMLAEFPNACFIFDEVHAYDPRVVGITLGSAKLLAQWGARFLFLSATLPEFLRKLITDAVGEPTFIDLDPNKDEDRGILERTRHVVEFKDGSLNDHMGFLIQEIESHSSTLIVCNHVRTSQEIYARMKSELPGREVSLLHSRFNREDRNRIEDAVLDKPMPKVMIATQVIEVSLDVDFEQAFLEPAPIDALIQRMGRVNRSGQRPPARVVVFTEQVNRNNLYCRCRGESHQHECRVRMTINELQKLVNPISERDLVDAADRVYGDGYQGEDKAKFEEGLHHPDIEEFENNLLAGAHQDWVEEIIEKTDGIVEFLPRCLLQEYTQRRENGLWVEANNLLVPVRIRSLAWLISRFDTSSDPWVADLGYTPDRGLELGVTDTTQSDNIC